jgi:hypothetical protein
MINWSGVLRIFRYAFLPLFGPAASAQFKEIGPPPLSQAVTHQRIRALLNQVTPTNRQQTIDQLNTLVPWFRKSWVRS